MSDTFIQRIKAEDIHFVENKDTYFRLMIRGYLFRKNIPELAEQFIVYFKCNKNEYGSEDFGRNQLEGYDLEIEYFREQDFFNTSNWWSLKTYEQKFPELKYKSMRWIMRNTIELEPNQVQIWKTHSNDGEKVYLSISNDLIGCKDVYGLVFVKMTIGYDELYEKIKVQLHKIRLNYSKRFWIKENLPEIDLFSEIEFYQ
jgi:hypothetical protein